MTTEALEVVAPVVETPAVPAAEAKPDRGDDFTPPPEVAVTAETEPVVAPVIPPDPTKEPKVEDEKKVDDKKVDDKKADDEKPRDADGKFVAKPPIMIPKARFDEVNEKAKTRVAALEGQIKDLNARLGLKDGQAPDTAALQAVVDAKTAEYGALIADSELDKANAVMKEILAANRKISAIESAALTGAHGRETQNVQTITELVDLFKVSYPVFDDKADTYNQGYVDFVAQLQDRFERTGSSSAEALREAVELAVAKFGLDVPEAAPPAVDPKTKVEGERKSAAAKASAAAAAGQSKELKTGLDSDKAGASHVRPTELSYEEFAALSEKQKQNLRGDLL